MSLRLEDWKWACIAAVVLTGLAILVVFAINPGGFESQLAWFVLLPAGIFCFGFLPQSGTPCTARCVLGLDGKPQLPLVLDNQLHRN